jgi:dephospho-CoA kinase
MLEHLGAFGIDADDYSHRAIAKGAPGYRQVVEYFGQWVIGEDGEIDRARLGRMVFSDPQAMLRLETIIHPLVLQAADWMIERSNKPVVVVEAIKLFETSLSTICDSKWVVCATPEVQLLRLMQKRGMTEAEARQRIQAQTPQDQKIAAADVVIRNDSSLEDTWRQVITAWQKIDPVRSSTIEEPPLPVVEQTPQEVRIVRGRPRDTAEMAALLDQVKPGTHAEDVLAAFGEKAFLLMRVGDRLVGWLGWQIENLVARTTDIVVAPSMKIDQAVPALVQEMERASRDLQCEASLVFAPAALAQDGLWRGLGYDRRMPQSLGVPAWQEAAKEMLKPGMTLYFKQLRQDRVLRPI